MKPYYQDVKLGVTLYLGDCREVMAGLAAESVLSVVTDPPYGLDFMGKAWDHGVPGVEYWRVISQAVRPGGYMLAMGGTRTYHRLTCAIEDAGWQIRDCLNWLHASGYPKGKGCLKPAWEPVLLARKPGGKVLPLGVEECRVPCESRAVGETRAGRYPANVAHDGSEEVMEAFAAFGEKTSGRGIKAPPGKLNGFCDGRTSMRRDGDKVYQGDTGTAARFFYCAKAAGSERGNQVKEGLPLFGVESEEFKNQHPTVKPLALMKWLVRLITPPGETCLDPFAGSATTGVACIQTGRRFIGVELEEPSAETAARRLEQGVLAFDN